MGNRWLERPWLVFALVMVWKGALLLLTAQPVPANDSFFYDGAVVNYLLHGRYVNPVLAQTYPISGTEVFSAYPPLYQAVLLGWMWVLGTSALAAMTLHYVLFGFYVVLAYAVLRRAKLPIWSFHVAGAFLFGITFHDRPDSLAQVFGMAAVYAWMRAWLESGPVPRSRVNAQWAWIAVGLVILTLATSLQIGGVYLVLITLGMVAWTRLAGTKFPWAPSSALVAVPVVLIGFVQSVFPQFWAGFLEHARNTPSLTGWRVPEVNDILKVVRTVPGILAVAGAGGLLLCRKGRLWRQADAQVFGLGLICTATALGVVLASLFVLTPNLVAVAAYFQPVIVGTYLAVAEAWQQRHAQKPELPLVNARAAGVGRHRWHAAVFACLAAVGAIRALGMTTWGIACAADVGYRKAMARVSSELAQTPRRSTVVLSAAYLYEAARVKDLTQIHSDWLNAPPVAAPHWERDGLLKLKPAKLILTQFDYYRRYQPILQELEAHPEIVTFQMDDPARVRPPDAIRPLQRVVQHIAWAPITVTLSWQ